MRIADMIRVTYRIAEIGPTRQRATADVRVTNQRDEEVAVAVHLLKWLESETRDRAGSPQPG